MLKSVLCDLDGTLVDSNHLHAEAWRRAFEHFGIQLTFDDTLHQIGKGGDQLIPVFVPVADRERLEEPLKEYRKKLFESEYFSQVKSFPGSRELLQKMRAAGLRVAIASSASKEDLAKLEQIAQITDLVEQEASSDDAETSKPAPDIFQAALKRLNLDPSDCLALGDTPWDIQAAKKAGMDTIALTCGGWSEQDLREAGALEVYRDATDLTARFEQSALVRR